MNLNFNTKLAEGYQSNSQIARILTENWVLIDLPHLLLQMGVDVFAQLKK